MNRDETLTEWLQQYGDLINRTCCLYLGDRALAEDATQDVFLRAWKSMAQFEGRNDASPRTWLVRIAINTCRNYRRTAWFRRTDRSVTPKDLTLPGATTITDVALAETDYATFSILEAAFDGRGASVTVKVAPKDSKTFLIGEGGYLLDAPASFTMQAAAPLWTAKVKADVEIPTSGIRIEEVSLTGTTLATYVDIRGTVMDEIAAEAVSIRVTDAAGQELRPGLTLIGGSGRLEAKEYVIPMESAPDVLYLLVHDYKTGVETPIALTVSP